jgi:L-fuculose-phosphate aldolase
MVTRVGGDSIRCVKYATFGTQALSNHALQALVDRMACLLANHGLIALGENLQSALDMALLVEDLAKQFFLCRQLGGPVLLDAEEMRINQEKFRAYGAQDAG